MAKTTKAAWGIDVGNCTLKAIKLAPADDDVEVLDFAVVEYEKILSQPDLDPQERTDLITKALSKFLDDHEVSGSTVVVNVPGQSSFARFIKLPPVENKRIPEIVRFEATQQIPFDISHVEWDWQTLQAPDSPEVEVGIFAIKKDLVGKALEPFTKTGCPVHIVQMAPMALYNFLYQDQRRLRDASAKEAIILLDIGAVNTDLVIADGNRVWQRSIPIGGNQFTAAVQKAFKLGFAKAEAIKRSASTSKYARQIFQAMRSVFADLAAEVQRSLGFYSSSNREVQFRQVLALGNTMKLPGLVKFLQQSLSLPVKRLSSFESLKLTSEISMAQFAENLPSLAVAYGLAVQGLEKGALVSNLLPRDLARKTQWQRKHPWFVAAASLFLLASLIYLFQAFSERRDINASVTQSNLRNIESYKATINSEFSKKANAEQQIQNSQAQIAQHKKYFKQRNTIPSILQAIRDCLPHEINTNDPQQKQIHAAYAKGDRAAILAIPRNQRQQVFFNRIRIVPVDDVDIDFNDVFPETEAVGGTQSGLGSITSSMSQGSMGQTQQSTMINPETGMPMAPVVVPGFFVEIEGTTPHKNGFEFLQPPRAGRDQWGFLHKLRYLGKTDTDIAADIKARGEYKTAQQSAAASGVLGYTGGYTGGYAGGYAGVGGLGYADTPDEIQEPNSTAGSEEPLPADTTVYPGHI
ncbi:type IV pilus assembly protein PilM, partial [Planctomycetota bacterium]